MKIEKKMILSTSIILALFLPEEKKKDGQVWGGEPSRHGGGTVYLASLEPASERICLNLAVKSIDSDKSRLCF